MSRFPQFPCHYPGVVRPAPALCSYLEYDCVKSKSGIHHDRGFHVTSYQANFASPPTRDRHVGFLSPQSGTEKYNQMSQNFLFSSYHYTKLQPSDKNILAHTFGWNFKSCYEVNPKWQRVLFFFSIPRCTKRKPGSGAKSCAYPVMQTLYYEQLYRLSN